MRLAAMQHPGPRLAAAARRRSYPLVLLPPLCCCAAPAAAAAPAQAAGPAAATFETLAAQIGLDASAVVLRDAGGALGRSLVATRDTPRGGVLLSLPKSACLIIDYGSKEGMRLPKGEWPRVRQGVGFKEPLTWDQLQALALMDSIAGDGGDFWGFYSDSLLPSPEALTVPMCWEEQLLSELRHPEVEEAAKAQQARLQSLFPGLSRPPAPGVPSWLQWGFACVRSRAFRVGDEAWASIPFVDMANHSFDPNSDFLAPKGGEAFQLVAVKEIKAGEEVTLSYSGPAGFTNRRFMAQYGFVPRDGNPADKIEFEAPDGIALSMEQVEDVLGEGLLMDAAQGKNYYLFAALRSLPLKISSPEQEAAVAAAAAAATAGAGQPGLGAGLRVGSEEEQRALVASLLAQVEAQIFESSGGGKTTLQEDEQLLKDLISKQQQLEQAASSASGGTDGSSGGEFDARLVAAVSYRVERRRLLQAGRVVLGALDRALGGAGAAAAAS